SSPEGTAINLTSTVTDPSPVDQGNPFTYQWSVTKNGNAFATGTPTNLATFSFTPDDNGTYVVSLQATDKDGGVGTAPSQTVIVTNVAPTLTAPAAPAPVTEGSSNSFNLGSFTDPG